MASLATKTEKSNEQERGKDYCKGADAKGWPKKKLSECTAAMYKCVDWLESLESWEGAMKEMKNDYSMRYCGDVQTHVRFDLLKDYYFSTVV